MIQLHVFSSFLYSSMIIFGQSKENFCVVILVLYIPKINPSAYTIN